MSGDDDAYAMKFVKEDNWKKWRRCESGNLSFDLPEFFNKFLIEVI